MMVYWKLLLVLCVANICYAKSIKESTRQSNNKSFQFDDVVPNKFGQLGFNGTWISGNEFTYSTGGSFVKYNVESKVTDTILPKEFINTKAWSGPSYRFSTDGSKILIRYAQRQIFRHSTVSKFSVINYPNINEAEFKIADGKEIQTAFFSPISNGLLFIEDNDIYFVNFTDLGSVTRITTDGKPGVIYNGIPDWVYEEEVLGTDAASWFSPNGLHLAFIRFNDEKVHEAIYNLYGNDEKQYPEEVHLRYPKAGTTNPTVSLFLVNLQSSAIKTELSIPLSVTDDHILGSVFWINEQELGAIWMNRRQNHGVFVSYNSLTYERKEIMKIEEPEGWIDVNTPKCDENSVCYFINNHGNWPTLTSVDTTNPQKITQLSAAGMNVLSFYGIKNGTYYFLSTPAADEAFNRHVYTNWNTCITCKENTPEGNKCAYASTSFSKDLSHYIMTCSGPDPSFAKVMQTNGYQELSIWEPNTDLRERMRQYDFPQTKIFSVPIKGTAFNAVVKMQLPSKVNFELLNASQGKYPMLVRVYGGPGSIRVANSFGVDFQTYQITNKSIIYVEIDGRGTAQKGIDMMFSVNNLLGTYEMEDQIAVAQYLAEKYKFIDGSRIGIWGWSYGGYATAMTLAKDTNKIFQCGISVAPVTSWRFYDSIYTERYMGINSSASNYVTSDVATIENVKQIGNHEFFLIHGNADDNVHYQQSMVLARELELQDIIFEQLSYPDEAHSISGTRRHLYHSMDRFWDKCFKM